MLPVFGGDSYTWTDNFMNGRANGLATYRNQDFFGLVEGLNFALQYQGTNEGQAPVLPVAIRLKPGPLAQNTMQTTFTWR